MQLRDFYDVCGPAIVAAHAQGVALLDELLNVASVEDAECRHNAKLAALTTESNVAALQPSERHVLEDLLDRIMNPAVPQLTNSDGEDMEFMRLVYRLAQGVTPALIRAALNREPDLDAASETFWNWLEPKKAPRKKRKASADNK